MEAINVLYDVLLNQGTGLAPRGRLGFNLRFLDVIVEETRALDASTITAASNDKALVDCVVAVYTKIKEHKGRLFSKSLPQLLNS